MSSLRPRLSFANVLSVITLFIVLGGGAYAATKLKRNAVKSKHIAPNAVQGVDALESSFDTVPSAATAGTAANADNADTVGGFSPGDFQGGNGFDDANAGLVDDGEVGAIVFFEGAIGIGCSATPTLLYADFGPDPFDTDLWLEGTHEIVPDEGSSVMPPVTLDPEDTAQVHVWGGGGTVAQLVASVRWDGTETECTLAFTSQENLEGSGVAIAARDASPARGELPDGWVTPKRGP